MSKIKTKYIIIKHLIYMVPVRSWRSYLMHKLPRYEHRLVYSDDDVKLFNKTIKQYPSILSPAETLDIILKNQLSFCRIGDGEFNSIINECNVFEPFNAKLAEQMLKICQNTETKNCLICLNKYDISKEMWMHNWFRFHGTFFLPKIINQVHFGRFVYGDAYFLMRLINSRAEFYKNLNKIQLLWNKRRVLFVCNKDSLSITDKLGVLSNIVEKQFIFIPAQNAFSQYDKILSNILSYPKDYLIYIEAGATASILSLELSQYGYQVYDMGDFYKRLMQIYNQLHKKFCIRSILHPKQQQVIFDVHTINV